MKQSIHLLFLTTITLALAACSSTPTTSPPFGETTRSTTYQKGVPGGTIVETTRWKATVTAIDVAGRVLTLVNSSGQHQTLRCGPEVANFDQIRVGDLVQGTVTSKLTMALANAGERPVTPVSAGAGADGGLGETQEYTATVSRINRRRREVTLRLPDDTTRTFTVRSDVDLAQRKVGEKVAVRVSVATAISVEKPKR